MSGGGAMGWVAALLVLLAVLKFGHVDLRAGNHHDVRRRPLVATMSAVRNLARGYSGGRYLSVR